jgi:hypothetical protein
MEVFICIKIQSPNRRRGVLRGRRRASNVGDVRANSPHKMYQDHQSYPHQIAKSLFSEHSQGLRPRHCAAPGHDIPERSSSLVPLVGGIPGIPGETRKLSILTGHKIEPDCLISWFQSELSDSYPFHQHHFQERISPSNTSLLSPPRPPLSVCPGEDSFRGGR